MKIHNIKIVIFMMLIYIANPYASAFCAGFTSLNDCLITNDIGIYSGRARGTNMGAGSGIIGSAGHFNQDHVDNVCTASYSNVNQLRGRPAEEIEQQLISVEVQVTKHSGSDSDKWLLHEVELSYQKSGTLGAAYAAPNPLRDIGGNKILFMWGYYAWVSNKVVVSIKFTDLTGTKPEPLEVVQAYLQKFPSTIPPTVELDRSHKIQWIKDELDRRLWLCDKWFYQLQLGKVEQNKALQESVDDMNEFLDYREKYYGIKAANEKNLLAGYLNTNNGTGIKAKLKEYKDWWTSNKDKAISL